MEEKKRDEEKDLKNRNRVNEIYIGKRASLGFWITLVSSNNSSIDA